MHENEIPKTKILIVDDEKLICDGLKNLFSKSRSMKVAGIAYSGLEAIEKAKEINPDIILMDIKMPGMDGIECTRTILGLFPEIKILMLSGKSQKKYVKAAIKAGAHGYLIKELNFKELTKAIRNILNGKTHVWDPVVLSKAHIGFEEFSTQEKEILILISNGKSNKLIAKKLHIPYPTLQRIKVDMRKKVHAKNDAQMINIAYKHHFLSADELI